MVSGTRTGDRTNGHVERGASSACSFTGGAGSTAYRGKVKVQVVSGTRTDDRTNGHVERGASSAGSFTGRAGGTAYRGKVKVQVVSSTPIQVVSYPVFLKN